MNEFIGKLIGKLEEKANQTWLVLAERNGYERAIEIVNQLAEEYINCSTDTSTNTSSGWIPCSERLPEPGKRYLVSSVWKDKNFEKHSVYDAVYGVDGIWHTYEYKPTLYEVIAWQPLPEPYHPKGGES